MIITNVLNNKHLLQWDFICNMDTTVSQIRPINPCSLSKTLPRILFIVLFQVFIPAVLADSLGRAEHIFQELFYLVDVCLHLSVEGDEWGMGPWGQVLQVCWFPGAKQKKQKKLQKHIRTAEHNAEIRLILRMYCGRPLFV